MTDELLKEILQELKKLNAHFENSQKYTHNRQEEMRHVRTMLVESMKGFNPQMGEKIGEMFDKFTGGDNHG